MATLKLEITPVLAQGSAEALQKELSRIGNFKINVDTQGAQATQQLAAGLKTAATNAEQLAGKFGKLTYTYASAEQDATKLAQAIRETTDAYGHTERTIDRIKDKEHSYTLQVIDDAQARAKADAQAAREIEREEEELRKRQKAIWKAFAAEQEEYERGVAEARVRQAEVANRQAVQYEEEAQRQRTAQWKAYFDKLNADLEQQSRQNAAANRQAVQDEEEAQRQRTARWKAYFAERDAESEQRAIQGRRDNRQAVIDEEEAQKKRTAQWKAYFDNINRQIAERQRLLQAERQNEDREDAARARAANQVDVLRAGYANLVRQIERLKTIYPAGTFDEIEQQAREAKEQVDNLDRSAETFVSDVEHWSSTLRRLKADTANARAETKELEKNTESLWMNFKKFTRWYLLGNISVKIVSGFREALSVMKEVDQELTNIQKVSNLTAQEVQKIGESAYATASKYGVSAQEYLSAVYTFQKAGLGSSAEAMGELAVKTMLVGDTTADVATKFLIAANAAWKFGGDVDKLSAIVDQADYLNNNYAVSLEDIASALPIVAATASQAGMSVEQTMAAITTIVSQTAVTGNRAGTALRAIIMNLAGETGTLEDGMEVTEETIKTVNGLLEKFAPDAIAAAKAAGTIVDPMKAIAAIAEGMKEGVLTSGELFGLVAETGGKLRANQLNALIQGQETYNAALAGTADAAGTADKEIQTMLESWNAKTQILKNTFTEFVSKTISSDFFKVILDASTLLVKFADNGWYAAAALGGLLAVFKSKSIVKGFSDAIAEVGKAFSGAAGAATSFVSVIGGVAAALGVALMVINQINEARKESEAAAVSEGQELADLADRYEDIADKMRDESTDRGTLNELIQSSASRYSDEFEAISDINEARERGIELIQEEAQERAREYMRQHGADYRRALDYLNPNNRSVDLGAGYYVGAQAGLDILSGQIDALNSKDNLSALEQANLASLQKRYTALKETVEQYREIVRLYEQAEAIANGTYVSSSHTTGGGTGATDPTEPFAAETKSVQNLVDLLEEAKQLGLDLSQTVFGNIDTNNRAVLEWTEDNLKKYKKELESWGYEVEDLMGSISTVMGTSSEYDGIEIAFSPILQTKNGPVLLSAETVDKYIFGLIAEAGEDWSPEELFALDWTGLEIDGTKIQGLLADIGDTAIATGEAMHYAGKDGALALAGFKGYASDAATELKRVSERATAMDTAISGVTEALEKYGAGSYEVYKAMYELEHTIPGATSNLYDLETAEWKVDAAQFADKQSLIDLIDASKQMEFTNAINALGDLADSYNEVADAAWKAFAAAATMDMGLSETDLARAADWMGIDTNMSAKMSTYNSILKQKEEWDAYIAGLRERTKTPGTGGGGKTPQELELERLKGIVSLRKSELSLLEASGAAEEDILAKRKEIQAALHDQAEYMRSIGADQEDINALSTEWWKIQKDILDAEEKIREEQEKIKENQRKMFDTLKETVDDYLSKVVSDKEKQLELEEKILAVQEAQANLANAQAERTVRYWNAATGQWEWGADANAVKSAQDALKSAKESLTDYKTTVAYNEFKTAWAEVAKSIKAGSVTFDEAYKYMYGKMVEIQDEYGVDLEPVLEDSIGSFKGLTETIEGLDDETATGLGESVGKVKKAVSNYSTAVTALQQAFDDIKKAVDSGDTPIKDAFGLLKQKAQEISDEYGIDLVGPLDQAIQGMGKVNGGIDDLWKQTVITLMRANSVNWFSATESEKAALHAENEFLGKLIGATYDPEGYWRLDNKNLYDPKDATGTISTSGSGENGTVTPTGAGAANTESGSAPSYYGQSLYGIAYPKSEADEENFDWEGFYNAVLNAALENGDYAVAKLLARQMREGVQTRHYYTDPTSGRILYTEEMVPLYDGGGVLHGMGGIKATRRDEMILPPDITERMLDPLHNYLADSRINDLRMMLGMKGKPMAQQSIGSMHNGDIFQMGGITMTEGQARSTTVYDLAQMARRLGNYKQGN